MSKRKLIICLACLLPFTANKVMAQEMKAVRTGQTTGSIDLKMKDAAAPVYIDYVVSPAYPDNELLEMKTTGSFTFNGHIVDAKGREVLQMPSQAVGGRYYNSIDISQLKPGKYFIELTGAGLTSRSRIPFTKAKAK